MKILLTFLVTLLSFTESFATAQTPDKIIYKGKEYALLTNPLEQYFKLHPEKRPKSNIGSSALWRGYIATFEFTDNGLMIKDIEVMSETKDEEIEMKSVLEEIFPQPTDRKADWYTGMLTLPYGKMINYVHMGYASTYENYILIEINQGKFIKDFHFDHTAYRDYKQKQFDEFKKTEVYLLKEQELQEKGLEKKHVEDFLKKFANDYTENKIPALNKK